MWSLEPKKMVLPLKQAIIKHLENKQTTTTTTQKLIASNHILYVSEYYIAKKQELTGVVNPSKEKLFSVYKNMIQDKHRYNIH